MKNKFLVFLFIIFCSKSKAQLINTNPTLKDIYTKKIGNLRFSTSTLAFGKVFTNQIKEDTIHIMNSGTSELTLLINSKTDYLEFVLSSDKIASGQEGWIAVSYNASKKKDFGFVLDRIVLNTNDKEQPIKNINITATIEEYFSENDSLSPKAVFNQLNYEYGEIFQGEKISHDFIVTNTGIKPLVIRKVKSTCGCIKTSITKTEILKGESGIVHVDFDSFGKEGKDNRTIIVYLNDPAKPVVNLDLNGSVKK